MSELQPPPLAPTSAPTPPAPAAPAAKSRSGAARGSRATTALLLVVAALAVGAAALAWTSQQRVQTLEQELVRRQQQSAGQATEAQLFAKQAQELARDAVAKVALLESRIAEVAVQRGQLEELIQSLTRSRDENLLGDIEAGLRVALQQTAITGSAEPLVAALQAADERLARINQPRLANVRRALLHDLDRTKAAGVADIATLAMKLDEAVRLVDEAPLLVLEPAPPAPRPTPAPRRGAAAPAASASVPAPRASAVDWLPASAGDWWQGVWRELRGLVRVTRIDQPEAMLLAPEQGLLLRENLKLRLLNARLALLSRQYDAAQSDLRTVLLAIDRYFERGSRKTATLTELLQGVATQARQAGVPRPDDTLAALAAAAAGR